MCRTGMAKHTVLCIETHVVAAVHKQFLRHNTGESASVEIFLPLIEIQNR